MNGDATHRTGQIFWDKGARSIPLRQDSTRHPVRGQVLVPGCGLGHEVAVEHGLDANGLDIAPTVVAQARALYPALAWRFLAANL